MGFKERFDRAKAVAGIVGALSGVGGDPVVKNSTPELADQHAKYVKEVRLPATRREIQRTLDAATRSKAHRQKHPPMLTKKDLKNLQ